MPQIWAGLVGGLLWSASRLDTEKTGVLGAACTAGCQGRPIFRIWEELLDIRALCPF